MTGRIWWATSLVAIVVVATAAMSGLPPATAQNETRGLDCSISSVGLTPLTDLGPNSYMGAQGGLYPGGVNEMPPSHLAVGLARAAAIEPLDAAGNPSADGQVVFASVGFSNPWREFGEFVRLVPAIDNLESSVVVVNGAQGGEHILEWSDPRGRPWQGLDFELAAAGVTAEQVQGLWIKMTQRAGVSPIQPFPDDALTYERELATVVSLLQERLPNLQVAYVSSRTYGGYGGEASPSPEPIAYEEGFGVKWLIERQIDGDPSLNADPAAGPVVAPWLAWGPYLWADGTTPREDGLTWACSEYRGDGAHLESSGNRKVATMLLDFLQTEPTAAWLFDDRELPPPPPGAVGPTPTSTVPEETVPDSTIGASTTTTSSSVTTTTTGPLAGPAERQTPESSRVPVAVWVLVGVAGGLLTGAGVFAVIERRRRRRGA